MRKELISGYLQHKGELKNINIKTDNGERKATVINFAISENGNFRRITAWDDVAEKIAETKKGSIVLAACDKTEKTLNEAVRDKDGKKILNSNNEIILKTEEKITCKRFENDKEIVNELQNQFNAMVNDFVTGEIDEIYRIPDKLYFEKTNEKTTTAIDKEIIKSLDEEIVRADKLSYFI